MYNRDKIMRKLLGKPTTESSTDTSLGVTSSPTPASYRPIASQNACYNANVPIGSIDKSPDGRSAVLSGRHILRVVRLDGLAWKEVVDLRAIITSQQASKSSSVGSTADQLSIKDVKWAQGHGDTSIFTACANGKIFQYDLARLGGGVEGGPLECVQTREDSRQVNTLDINPHRGTYLLSGSQDGIIRCFDIRSPVRTQTGHLTFRALQAFKGNADGVRHVKWSPKDGFFFACGTESGVVMKWDIRKAAAPMLRISGHEKACASIAWHQDGDHLISGGWDNKCHIWDVSSKADKRQKSKCSIYTPAPVSSVAWRPGQWSATAQGKRTAQVAVSYDESSQIRHGVNACHIWDLARPTMPFRELSKFDKPPAAILWHDQDLLWTAGNDGLLNQFDIAFAPKVIDRTSMSAMAFSSQGEVLMFLDERPPTHRPRRPVVHTDVAPHSSYGSSPTTPMLSISRSDSEDEVMGSFLGARRKGLRKRRSGTRSSQAVSTTPPSDPGDHILALEQSLKVTGLYKSQQGMAIGPVPSAAKVNVYHYLSVHYLETLNEVLPYRQDGRALVERVLAILEHYAKAAEMVSQFRLAQTWRILAYSMNLLLTRRAQYHLDVRTGKFETRKSPNLHSQDRSRIGASKSAGSIGQYLSVTGDGTPRRTLSGTSLDRYGGARSLLAEEIESTSNVPTPIARPADGSYNGSGTNNGGFTSTYGKKLTPLLDTDGFSLPPAAVHQTFSLASRRRLDSTPLSETSQDSDHTQASVEGYDFYDMDTISKAIDVPPPKKTEPVVIDYLAPRSPTSQRKPAVRQDSDESFAQLFSISDGSRRTTGLTGSSGSSVPKQSRITRVSEEFVDSGSEATSSEFESRIRGKELGESFGFQKLPHLAQADPTSQQTQTSEDEFRMATQTTVDSVNSQQGEAHPRPDSYPEVSPEQGVPPQLRLLKGADFPVPKEGEQEAKETPRETDYLPWPDDPPYPYPSPTQPSDYPDKPSAFHPYSLLTRALAFETKSSALNASAMILLLKPLVPDELIDPFQASAILKQHHSRLMGMKLFVEAALLRNLCVQGWPGEPLIYWGDSYPAIFRSAQDRVSVGFLCPQCRKPRELDPKVKGAIWRCERCRTVMGPCAVCGHREVTESLHPDTAIPLKSGLLSVSAKEGRQDTLMGHEPILATWWYCAGCGHGGHATCLQIWHAGLDASGGDEGDAEKNRAGDSSGVSEYSDGCCPVDGCGHACLPGKWRNESTVARTEEVTRAVREVTRTKTSSSSPIIKDDRRRGGLFGSAETGVYGDGNEVLQSRAVDIVRETLASSGSPASRGPGASVLSSSPGRSSGVGERERRKSVKFARAEERR